MSISIRFSVKADDEINITHQSSLRKIWSKLMILKTDNEDRQRLKRARRALHLHVESTRGYKFDAVQELAHFFQASEALGVDVEYEVGENWEELRDLTDRFLSSVDFANELAHDIRAHVKAVDFHRDDLSERKACTDEKIDGLLASSRHITDETFSLFEILFHLTHQMRKHTEWGVQFDRSGDQYKTMKKQIQMAREALDEYLLMSIMPGFRPDFNVWGGTTSLSRVVKQITERLVALGDLLTTTCPDDIDLEYLPPLIEQLSTKTSLIKNRLEA